ncbi:MAG: ATP-grasp domain-containing protein [Actinomycetota bacterium]|nr:ATP-grasp domain-containing protein [Actinomycetota bacterium]
MTWSVSWKPSPPEGCATSSAHNRRDLDLAAQRVLVTDAGRGSALAIIRALGRRGVYVVAADSDRHSPGFYSRYTAERVRYPEPREQPRSVVSSLLVAAREHRVTLILPVTDDVILPLSSERDRFSDVCRLALPDPAALAAVTDKQATVDLARRHGVPVPRTAVVKTVREAREQAPLLGWPVVVKPHTSRSYRDGDYIEAFSVSYAETVRELEDQVRRLEGRAAVLLQEYYRGEAHGVGLLMDRGRPLAAFQHRRIREVPVTGGASSFRESVPLDPTLCDYAVRLLAALAWTGVAMVEFKLGDEGPRLMEINGRVWGSLPLAVKSGIDFPGRMVDLYVNGSGDGEASLDSTYRLGVRSRHLELEVAWIGSVLRRNRGYSWVRLPRRRDAVAAAVLLLKPADGYDILARDDILPGLVEIVKIAAKLRTKLVERA